MKKAIIFDMDGVIFDTERACMNAMQRYVNNFGISLSEEMYKETIGLSGPLLTNKFRELFGDKVNCETLLDEVTKIVETEVQFKDIIKPGINNLLEFCKEQEYKMIVASSSYRKNILGMLENANILHFFEDVCGGDEVQYSKPYPDIFNMAQQKISINKSECIIIEDSVNGIIAANKAGIDVVCIPDMFMPSEDILNGVVCILNDANEMIEYLKKINK